MILRQADSSEVEAIRDLINAAFRVEKFFIDTDRITLEEVRERFKTGEFLLAEAENGCALAGCVYVEPQGDRAYLGLLSVDPTQQREGLGTRVLTAAEQRCRSLGCRFMDILIVNLREELPPFYRRRGYFETGTEPFPEEVATKLPCHFVKMSKAL